MESGSGSTAYDGGVLEIKVGSGSFTDILDAGGSFATGGYGSTINNSYGNPLAGRQAWSGDSGGFVPVVVNLPAAASGQTIQLQWRCGTDQNNGTAVGGWYIDAVKITGYWCWPDQAPTPPFAPTADSYNGLFYEPAGVELLRSGAFTAKTTTRGTYSGNLQMGASRCPFSGQFDFSGKATNTITRAGASPLTLLLQMDPVGNAHLNGTVSDGTWTANLTADRAVFKAQANPAPYAGKYTLVLPGTGNPGDTASPQGDGYGTITVGASGVVKLGGVLADGTKLTQTTTLSQEGQCPALCLAVRRAGAGPGLADVHQHGPGGPGRCGQLAQALRAEDAILPCGVQCRDKSRGLSLSARADDSESAVESVG